MTNEQRTEPDGASDAGTVGVPTGDTAPADPTPLEPPPLPLGRVEPVVVPRWMQAVVLAAALFALSGLARASRPVLLIFIVAGVIALILNPVVKLVQRRGLPRGAATGVVFLGFFGAVAGLVALLVNPIADQIQAFQRDLPGLVDNANSTLGRLQQWLDARGIDIQVRRPGETALETLGSNVGRGSDDILAFTRDLVTVIVEASFALVLILVIAIYMLLYGKQIGALVRRIMPPGDGTPEDDYPIRVQKAVFGYVRGQLTFSAIMGVSAGLALWVFGVLGIFPAGETYAVFFGVFYGVMELIPYVGPVLGSAPAVLVALAQGEPVTALWLVLMFLVLQQLEGHVVAPQIFGHSLRINPLFVIFALLLGGHLHGIVGALVALPLAAIVRETAAYLTRHLMLEPWGTPSAEALRVRSAAEGRGRRRRCVGCGTAAAPDAEFCFACGEPLGPAGTRFRADDGRTRRAPRPQLSLPPWARPAVRAASRLRARAA
ncbi:MAG: AI-2E family transporter, partial [Actinomycetota bacterium]|nr:AI-2E family transporter [Actinomycetota bacterium]